MHLSLTDAELLLTADKFLIGNASWTPKPNRDGRPEILVFESRVEIDRSIPRGLKFRITVFPSRLETATFQLDCDRPGARSRIPIYRMEWRPISPHTNSYDRSVPAELRGLSFISGETHEHVCTDSVATVEQRIKLGVSVARRIQADPSTYADALAYVCARIRIKNMGDIPPSNAQGSFI